MRFYLNETRNKIKQLEIIPFSEGIAKSLFHKYSSENICLQRFYEFLFRHIDMEPG